MPMYTLVSYMYKGHLNNLAFNKVRVAQSVEHRTTDLRAVRIPLWAFCILSLSLAGRLVPYK